MNLEDLERAAGIDPESESYKIASFNAEADDNLMETLVRLRKNSGVSREAVAATANRSVEWVERFERLGADPHMSTVRRYATAIQARVGHSVTVSEEP